MSQDLVQVLQRLGEPRLLVLGDLILDRYTWGDAERVSQEAPVILLRAERRESRLGGAANVGNMLRALGSQVVLAGVVGDDTAGSELIAEIERAGIDRTAVAVDRSRPTTVKERFIGRAQHRHPHQMLRVDREVREPLSADLERELSTRIEPLVAQSGAVLVSDYAKGVCTPWLLEGVIATARAARVPVLVDPARGRDYACYRGATAITPNRLETELASGIAIREPADSFVAGAQLCRQLELDAAIITLDRDGAALIHCDGRTAHFPTRPRQVYDITGAGDMMLSVIGLCLAAGVDYDSSIRLANVAGGLEVEQIGVALISREEIAADLFRGRRRRIPKVVELDTLADEIDARRRLGQRIVFTNGCFDMLHVGHVSYLQEAAELGDCLVVAINSDSSVKRLKGPGRPIVGHEHRAAMLAALEAVDYVIVFDQPTPHELLQRLRPDVLIKGGTYSVDEVVGREVVEAYGGQVRVAGQVEGVSTTALLERLRSIAPTVTRPHFTSEPSERASAPSVP